MNKAIILSPIFSPGTIWARYSLVINPVNYNLFSVNLFVAITGWSQLFRIWRWRTLATSSHIYLLLTQILLDSDTWPSFNQILSHDLRPIRFCHMTFVQSDFVTWPSSNHILLLCTQTMQVQAISHFISWTADPVIASHSDSWAITSCPICPIVTSCPIVTGCPICPIVTGCPIVTSCPIVTGWRDGDKRDWVTVCVHSVACTKRKHQSIHVDHSMWRAIYRMYVTV